MADNDCLPSCGWTRTFTVTSTGAGTWNVSVETLSDGLTLTTDKTSVAVTDGGDVDVTVTADSPPAPPTDEWLFGTLVLTPPAGSEAPVAHLPVGVLPSTGVLPSSIDITTRRDAGSQVTEPRGDRDRATCRSTRAAWSPRTRKAAVHRRGHHQHRPLRRQRRARRDDRVPAGATRLVAKLQNPTAPDFDLYVGPGEVSGGQRVARAPARAPPRRSTSPNPRPGTYWVLVQNWEATTAGGTDTADLVTAVVAGDQGNLRAEGPDGALPRRAVRHPHLLGRARDGRRRDLVRHAHSRHRARQRGDIGVIPVTVTRVEDDVTKSVGRGRGGTG